MVWKLSDLCLMCVQNNLDQYPNIGNSLPTYYKEVLVDRLGCHDRYFPDQLEHISKQLFTNRLRHIDFDRCVQINDKVLQLLGQSKASFESIILRGLDNVSDRGVQAVTENQTSLATLHLKYLPLITQKCLALVASPRLTEVKLKHSHQISKNWTTQAVLQDFFSKNPNIKFLKIHTETENIPVIARGLNSSLNELKINFQTASDSMIETLAENCPNLKKLDMNSAKLVGKDSLIKLFQACTQLEELDLGYCSRLASAGENEALWTLPQSLKSLSLCGMMLTDQTILVECVTRLKQLRKLNVCGVPALSDESLTQIMERMGPQLQSLNLSGLYTQEMSDEGLKAVAKHCTSLEALHISLLKNVTGVTLRPLFNCPQRAARITKLCINSRMLDVSVLDQVLASCPSMQILDLAGLTQVTDDMLMALADTALGLKELYIKGCKLVTDKSICYIAGKCTLTNLGLSGIHSITDKSIFCLASSCPYLEELWLNGCAQVSPVAVQYLQDMCLRRLYYKHNIPNASRDQLMAKNLDTGNFERADLL